MKAIIEDLILKKPHLADPLRFYAKVMKFMASVKEFPIAPQPGQTAYPPGLAARVADSLSEALGLPEGALSPLREALERGNVDFTKLPLGESPAFPLPYGEDDLAMLLFLASRPYFLAKCDACGPGANRTWEEGKCPVCNARPVLSSLSADGRRQLHCSFCGTVGDANRDQCPSCLTLDPGSLKTYAFKGEEGFSVLVCDACKSYAKTIDADLLSTMSPDLADLMSLPLDIVMQQKGFKRRSPNPLGMVNMSAAG
jgi:FdhE protein